jgi:hypothetical protein
MWHSLIGFEIRHRFFALIDFLAASSTQRYCAAAMACCSRA